MTSSKIIFLQLHSLHSLQCCEQCCSVYAFHSRVLECVHLFKFLCALWDVHMSPFADCHNKIAAPVSGWAAVQLCRRNTMSMCVFVFCSLVQVLLDEIVCSSVHRCVDPVMMEPSVSAPSKQSSVVGNEVTLGWLNSTRQTQTQSDRINERL